MSPWATTVCGTAGAKGDPTWKKPFWGVGNGDLKGVDSIRILFRIIMCSCCQGRMKYLEVSPWALEQVGSVNKRKTDQPLLPGQIFHIPGKLNPRNVWCVQDWNKFGFVENGGNFKWCLWRMGLESQGKKFMEVFLAKSAGGAWRC